MKFSRTQPVPADADADGSVQPAVNGRGKRHSEPSRRLFSRSDQTSEFTQATFDSLAAHVAVLDERGEIVAVNASWRAFADREGGGSDFVGSNYIEVCDAARDPQASTVAQGLRELLTNDRDGLELEYPCHSPSVQRWFLMSATRQAGSGPPRLVVVHLNVTELHEAQERALMQAALLDEIDVAVIVTDPDLKIVSWSAGAERMYEWTVQEAIGRTPMELEKARTGALYDPEPVLLALQRDGHWESEYVVRRKDRLELLGLSPQPAAARRAGRGAGVGRCLDGYLRAQGVRASAAECP